MIQIPFGAFWTLKKICINMHIVLWSNRNKEKQWLIFLFIIMISSFFCHSKIFVFVKILYFTPFQNHGELQQAWHTKDSCKTILYLMYHDFLLIFRDASVPPSPSLTSVQCSCFNDLFFFRLFLFHGLLLQLQPPQCWSHSQLQLQPVVGWN